jgi:ribokinase
MIGAVGHDAFGPKMVSDLSTSLIDTTAIRILPGLSTGVAVILVEESTGENRILLSPGANRTLQPSSFLTPESLGTPASGSLPSLIILQLEIPVPTVLQCIATAKKAGVAVLLNPAPAVPLPEEVFRDLDHLVLNESEAAILTGRAVEEVERDGFKWEEVGNEFLGKGVRNVIITLGSKGAFYASSSDERGYVGAEKVKVVDTTAAGDTFVGAYAVQVVSGRVEGGRGMGEVVQLACRAAGKTCEKAGAQSAIPWGDEVEGFAC